MYSTKVRATDFLDHRRFLEAVVEDLREQKVFSHRTFNRECGFASPNFVQLVIQGRRNLSKDAAERIARTLRLSKIDTRAFLRLRELNIETDPTRKLGLFESLLRHPDFAERHELAQAELGFYSKWYNVVVRELIQSHPTLSAREISQMLLPRVSEKEISTSLDEMIELGFIEKTRSGWKTKHKQLTTKNEILSSAIISFHSSMIDLAREALTRFKGDQREVSSVTLQLTDAQFLELRERIREFKKEALSIETSDPKARVYQFNFQLFPVTSDIEGES